MIESTIRLFPLAFQANLPQCHGIGKDVVDDGSLEASSIVTASSRGTRTDLEHGYIRRAG